MRKICYYLKFEFYSWMKPVFSHEMLTSIQSAFMFELMSVMPLDIKRHMIACLSYVLPVFVLKLIVKTEL